MDDSPADRRTTIEAAGAALQAAFPTAPGRVYELRAALRRREGGRLPGLALMRLEFFDARGRRVDPRIAGPDFHVPHLDPLTIETLPAGAEGDLAFDAGLASRFLAAPPDAVEARLALETPGIEILHLELEALAINWPAEGEKLLADVERAAASRRRLLAHLFPGDPLGEGERAEHGEAAPLDQLRAIARQFGRVGDWAAALAHCDAAAETAERAARIARLRIGEAARLTVGFIGSPRSHLRIAAYADAPLLREDAWEGQLAALALDAILIETAAESVAGDWAGAFCGLDGALSPLGRRLCAAARARGIPVRLHVTTGEGEIALWREMIETADGVTIEGDPAEWKAPPAGAFIRRATEPAVHPPLRQGSGEGTMLAPGASDVFQNPGFAALLNEGSCCDLLLTEFDYGFMPGALADRLPKARARALDLASQAQRTRLLQESAMVLLSGGTLRAPGQLAAAALDAIACGAIPVLFGPGEAGLDLALDRVWSAAELQELQRLHRIPWLRERRWRALWREVCRRHVWTASERAALLGRDPCAPDLDAPLMSVVMVSKRPHLIGACLETFRKQSWAEKELLLVLNTDAPPSELPELCPNERLFVAPESWNIGRCLNMAIRAARGRHWAKMDDDDHYSPHYLEELSAFFRATQADAVGRQSVYFFFAGAGESLARQNFHAQTFRPVSKDSFVSGATLAGRARSRLPKFSNRLRNCVDSEWIKALHKAGTRLFCYDSTSLVVYRDQDDSFHTWRLNATSWKKNPFTPFCSANAKIVLEQDTL